MHSILRSAILAVLAGSFLAPTAAAGPVADAVRVPAPGVTDHDHDADDGRVGARESIGSHTVDAPAPQSVSLHPSVVVRGAGADEQRRVVEALERFAAAGLMLPGIDIVFHDDPAGCRGHDGLFQEQYTPWRVLVCTELDYVLTHELAHVWEAANLDDAARARYVDFRNLPTWNSPDASWGDRGVEDAAFMLQQNLMAGTVDTSSERWVERTDAYAALTGQTSPIDRQRSAVDAQDSARMRTR